MSLKETSQNIVFLQKILRKGLIRIRSPLLTESRLIFFPRITKMFQFIRLLKPYKRITLIKLAYYAKFSIFGNLSVSLPPATLNFS